MLSFDDSKGRPIAKIKGGIYHNKIIYLTDDDDNKMIYNRPLDMINERDIRNGKKKLSKYEMQEIKRALMYNEQAKEQDIRDIVNNLKNKSTSKSKKEFNLYDGEIQPLPYFNKTERLYVCGPTESGKSYFTKEYLKNLRLVHPDARIIIFSDVDEDPGGLDELKNTIRVNLDDAPEKEAIDINKFNDSICVFDDIDSIQNKKIYKVVCDLRDAMLRRGRHNNISVICTSHLTTNYKETRIILNECSGIVIFPKSGSSSGLNYMLKKYCGLDKEQIKKIMNLPSRWVYIHNFYPKYICFSGGVFLL